MIVLMALIACSAEGKSTARGTNGWLVAGCVGGAGTRVIGQTGATLLLTTRGVADRRTVTFGGRRVMTGISHQPELFNTGSDLQIADIHP